MSGRVKTWFLAPTWDITPKSVKLGLIFFEPTPPFIDKGHAKFVPTNDDVGPCEEPSVKHDFRATVKEVKERKGGVFARFLGSVPVGGEATAERNKTAGECYFVKTLQSRSFVPSKELERKATSAADVAGFLEQSDYEKPVYMITGIRTAEGTSVTTLKKRGRSLRGWFGVDLSAANVPLAVGASGADKVSGSEFVTFRDSSEIVFAYQLREIRVSDGEVVGSDYLAGALLGADQDAKNEEKAVAGQEFSAASVEGLDKYQDKDEMDGGDCFCVFPALVE